MSSTPHLLVAVSSHGFGHFAQVVPVVNALHGKMPFLQVTMRTMLPERILRNRLDMPFELQRKADDFGMVNIDAFDVDGPASAARYRSFHRQWRERVEGTALDLATSGADLVLADVPYLTLAAAARAGIPAVGLCSLNWADIYWHYCGGEAEAEGIHADMLAAYRSAELFLRPEPSMPMAQLPNTRSIGPVAVLHPARREELRHRAGLPPDERLVLVAMGGIDTPMATECWPAIPGVTWVVPADWPMREDAVTLESLGASMAEVLPSADLLITKPGYGSFAEAAAAGIPVLYVPRNEWPESEYLVRWLERNGRCQAVARHELERGTIADQVMEMVQGERPDPVEPSGVVQAVDLLAERLSA